MSIDSTVFSKNQAKRIRALGRKKERQEAGQFVAEGSKLVLELIKSPLKVLEIWAQKDWLTEHSEALKYFPSSSIVPVNTSEMERLTLLSHASPVLAVLAIPEINASKTVEPITDFVMALDRVSDPGNLGTLLRLADWFGISQVVCSPETVDVYNPKVVQATMGSLARVNVSYHPLGDWLRQCRDQQPDVAICGAVMNGTGLYKSKIDFPAVLVMGSESHGLAPELEKWLTHRLTIPSFGGAESLNVATAAAIICAEMRRSTLGPPN